jgi:hypothetical protein
MRAIDKRERYRMQVGEGDSPGDNIDENHEIIGVEVKNAVLAGEHVQDQLVDGVRTVPTKNREEENCHKLHILHSSQ